MGVAAGRAAGSPVPGVPERFQRVFRPSDATVRRHQWAALTRRERLRATLEYYVRGKRFVGLDFGGNIYYEMSDGERVVEWPKKRYLWDVKQTIPYAWRLWLQNRAIPHPPHPEELILLEEEEGARLQKAQENIQRTEAIKRGPEPAQLPSAEDLDAFDREAPPASARASGPRPPSFTTGPPVR